MLLILAVCGFFSFGSGSQLTIGETQFEYELADTPEARQQGLSGRDSLESGSAMLFNFGKNDKHCIWMKDMRFAIDIIWLDDEQRIVHTEENVTQDTYPDQFCSETDSYYVIEVNAGEFAPTRAGQYEPVSF